MIDPFLIREPSINSPIFCIFFPSLWISRILIDLLLLQAISRLSDTTSPFFPTPLPISAFKILYLSPLKLKKAPGEGYKPFIFPMIFSGSSFQLI
tara:strand:+ start:384 stop:668 length:285 start_codon:yes stop_codon:yes gene_type:complete